MRGFMVERFQVFCLLLQSEEGTKELSSGDVEKRGYFRVS